MFTPKTTFDSPAYKSLAVCALSLAVLLPAQLAFAAPEVNAPSARELGIDPDGYRPTPIGAESIPYDFTATGPNHLRQMSPTEALPATLQTGETIIVIEEVEETF